MKSVAWCDFVTFLVPLIGTHTKNPPSVSVDFFILLYIWLEVTFWTKFFYFGIHVTCLTIIVPCSLQMPKLCLLLYLRGSKVKVVLQHSYSARNMTVVRVCFMAMDTAVMMLLHWCLSENGHSLSSPCFPSSSLVPYPLIFECLLFSLTAQNKHSLLLSPTHFF